MNYKLLRGRMVLRGSTLKVDFLCFLGAEEQELQAGFFPGANEHELHAGFSLPYQKILFLID